MNFTAVSEKEHDVFSFGTQKLDTVMDMVSTNVLTGSSPQTYQRYIHVEVHQFQILTALSNTEGIDGEETKARTLGISNLNDKTMFTWCTIEGPVLVCVASMYVPKSKKSRLFYALSSYKIVRSLFRWVVLPLTETGWKRMLHLSCILPRSHFRERDYDGTYEKRFIIAIRHRE